MAQYHLNTNVKVLGQTFDMPVRLVQTVGKHFRLKYR